MDSISTVISIQRIIWPWCIYYFYVDGFCDYAIRTMSFVSFRACCRKDIRKTQESQYYHNDSFTHISSAVLLDLLQCQYDLFQTAWKCIAVSKTNTDLCISNLCIWKWCMWKSHASMFDTRNYNCFHICCMVFLKEELFWDFFTDDELWKNQNKKTEKSDKICFFCSST